MIIKIDNEPIELRGGAVVSIDEVYEAVKETNSKFRALERRTEEMAFNIFEAIDFRMLSGLVGETLVTELSNSINMLEKNPNIDGYPDLVNVSKSEYKADFREWKKNNLGEFINFSYGGIEVKNTFGTKRSNVALPPGDTRINKISKKPEWKAHHTYTNHLLALLSDFIEGCPQIVAVMYCDQLVENDWSKKQDPKEGSTMTSFSVIQRSGWDKLRKRVLICNKDLPYKEYFGVKTYAN